MARPDHFGVKDRVAGGLLELPGVHGVGVGGKTTGGEPTGETSIVVFVERKVPLSELPPQQRIPDEIDGVKTDVVEQPVETIIQGVPGIPVGTKDVDDGEYRPLRGGIQIGRRGGPGLGTLGCICTVTGAPNRVIALTCHHVVFKQCTETPDSEEVGQPIGRSSSTESCHDIFGTLVDAQCDTDVDLALVQLQGGMQWLAQIEGDGVVAGTRPLTDADTNPPRLQVKKRGKTSGLTGGTVIGIGVIGTTRHEDGTVHRSYTNGIRIRANPDPAEPGDRDFGLQGDSGSVVRDLAGNVVGILFSSALGAGFATAFPIQAAIDKFTTGVPAERRIPLVVDIATTLGAVKTVPTAMAANEQPAPLPLSSAEAEQIEEELRTSRQGAWYADLYRRHRDEAAALVHSHRRVTVAWHRSGAAELFQCLWRAFKSPDLRVPAEIHGRPLRACLEELAAALERNGSDALTADLRRLLPVLPDVAGLTRREILERLKGPEPNPAGAQA